jgi:hypothetical protein
LMQVTFKRRAVLFFTHANYAMISFTRARKQIGVMLSEWNSKRSHRLNALGARRSKSQLRSAPTVK